MKKRKIGFSLIGAGIVLALGLVVAISACSSQFDPGSEIGETTIERLKAERLENVPFEDVEVLKGFAADPQILDYNTARKIALVEFLATGMDKDMGWEGNKIKETPVVIYGFDNKPKYYDFIVIDAEEHIVGTITAYARRTATTSIRAVSAGVKDYAGVLSKAGGINASLYEDWAGNPYLGVRGKAGDTPVSVIDADTGEVAEGIRELTDEEIIAALMEAFPTLATFDPGTIDLPEDDPLFDDVQNTIIEQLENSQSTGDIEASLNTALLDKTEQSEAFWNAIDEVLPDIESIKDEEEIIDASGKGLLSSLISWVVHKIVTLFTGVDTTRYYIDKYTNYPYASSYRNGATTCGVWACGYLKWISDGRTGDSYTSFFNCASSVGEFFVFNFALRFFELGTNGGRPMTPAEMTWALPLITKGKIWFGNTWLFNDSAAYDHIKITKNPAIVLCASGGQMHYRVAVGTRRTGSVFSETYYFLQHENKDSGKNFPNANSTSNKRDNDSEYKTVEWWNPWFLVIAN